MIYNRKTIPRPKSRAIKVNFSNFSGGVNTATDEHLLPQKFAKMAYNFSGSSGVLKNCFGVEEFASIPSDFKAIRCFYYRRFDKDTQGNDDKFVLLGEDLQLYYIDIDETTLHKVEGARFTSLPVAINYRLNDQDVIIFSSESDDMMVWNGVDEPTVILDAPKITSMCVHYERLFATINGEKSSLWFSADLDPTNWNISLDGAGFIEMADERGQLLKVLSFLDYVYVFRGNGIARVTAYGDQTQFNVSQLYTGTGKIFEGTPVICGDRVIFLAEDGLYVFDGISTYRILDNIRGMFAEGNRQAVAAYLNGKYYLACRLDFGDDKYLCEEGEYQNNALIEYDISSRSFSILRGIDVLSLTTARGEQFSKLIVCLQDGRMGCITDQGGLFGNPLRKSWLTPVSDLGSPDRKKLLKEIYLLSHEDIILRVYTDGEMTEYQIEGSKKVTCRRLGLTGTLVGLEFISLSGQPYIAKPMLTAEVI